MKFLCQLVQRLVMAQTDRQTDRHDENITSTAYAGGKNGWNFKILTFQLHILRTYMYTCARYDVSMIHRQRQYQQQ